MEKNNCLKLFPRGFLVLHSPFATAGIHPRYSTLVRMVGSLSLNAVPGSEGHIGRRMRADTTIRGNPESPTSAYGVPP